MTTYTQEEQIAQAMAYMKTCPNMAWACGFMEDLQHMGPDGTCWRKEFNKVLEVVKKEEERIECHDCGEKLLICDSGMRLCSVGCKDKWVNSKGEILQDKTDE